MFTNQELIKMWSNDQKRRAFIASYKAWGLWFSQPELGLSYYKYDLPEGGGRIIAMEYFRAPYPLERMEQYARPSNGGNTRTSNSAIDSAISTTKKNDAVLCKVFYLQTGDYFSPSAVSDSVIAEHLKQLKGKLTKELSESEVQ